MNILLLQKNLKQGVFATSYITGKNTNLPILNNLLIQAKDGIIKLISTDLEMGITSIVRGKIEKEGSLTINAKILGSYINLLPNIKTELSFEGSNLIVEADNYKTKINGELADDYPLIPDINRDESYLLSLNDFKNAVNSVIFSVSADESRPALSGIFLVIEGDKMVLVGTDSYRLAEISIKLKENSNTSDEKRIIIPLKTLTELARIAGGDYSDNKDNDDLKIILNDNQIVFIFDNIEIVSRLIDERYPDYKQIIPNNKKTTILIDKDELMRAVKTSAIFSKSGVNDVILDINSEANELTISAGSGQTGENTTKLKVKVEGENNSVTINHRYLIDGLNNLHSLIVKLEITDSNTPCILKSNDIENYLYIMMPIKR